VSLEEEIPLGTLGPLARRWGNHKERKWIESPILIHKLGWEYGSQPEDLMMECSLITEIDEIGKSAIGELCNMILGYTATLFSRGNIIVDITPVICLVKLPGRIIAQSMQQFML